MTSETIGSGRPLPEVTPWSKEFWLGLARGEFLLQRCKQCSSWQHYPKPRCMVCGGRALGWVSASGSATVYTWTRIQANPPTPFTDLLPYTLVIAALTEGPRILARYVGEREPVCDSPLHVVYEARDDGLLLPAFAEVNDG